MGGDHWLLPFLLFLLVLRLQTAESAIEKNQQRRSHRQSNDNIIAIIIIIVIIIRGE